MQPIGVFDSGLGGLSVLRELRTLLPNETFCYVGDTLQVPWGGRDPEQIRVFSLAISGFLIEERNCRAIVVACNTATSAAAETLRQTFAVPIVAMEPGIKPAVAATRSGKIAVLATEKTLASERLERLVSRWAGPDRGVSVVTRPCPGWVEAVEAGAFDTPATELLIRQVVAPLIHSGVDTLVLGCTHYPFLRPLIAQAAGEGVVLVDTGPAVARQVARVLHPERIEQEVFRSTANTTFNNRNPNAPVSVWVTDDVTRSAPVIRRCLGTEEAVTVRHACWEEGHLHDATN